MLTRRLSPRIRPIDALDPIARFCSRHDLPWDDRRRGRFETYVDRIEKFDGSMNLVGAETRSEIVEDLLLDSLVPAALAPPDGSVLDVGTGAGLPGIPLAILYPDLPFTLVEPRQDRSTFLKIARTRLELDRIAIERARIEDLPDATFDWVVSKAFRAPPEWLEVACRRVSDGGHIVCMTGEGGHDEVELAADDLDLEPAAACDDTADLGLPERDPSRGVYVLRRATGGD
ncbi:MAG: 16S rRNA (guanine(527)-N(7))-methyltransferase RsmG [Bradymonadaceae bacterium]